MRENSASLVVLRLMCADGQCYLCPGVSHSVSVSEWCNFATARSKRRLKSHHENRPQCTPACDASSDHAWFQQVLAFQLYNCASMKLRRTCDVCWITELPYRVPGSHRELQPLSTAGVTAGLASALSVVLSHTALTLECLILSRA